MTNFAEKPEEYGSKYNPIFEASRQLPIPATEKKQYLRSMFGDKIESVLSDEDRKEAWEQGKAEGIAEGKTEGASAIAKAMLEDGMAIDSISKYTGLSAEEIASLS